MLLSLIKDGISEGPDFSPVCPADENWPVSLRCVQGVPQAALIGVVFRIVLIPGFERAGP